MVDVGTGHEPTLVFKNKVNGLLVSFPALNIHTSYLHAERAFSLVRV